MTAVAYHAYTRLVIAFEIAMRLVTDDPQYQRKEGEWADDSSCANCDLIIRTGKAIVCPMRGVAIQSMLGARL